MKGTKPLALLLAVTLALSFVAISPAAAYGDDCDVSVDQDDLDISQDINLDQDVDQSNSADIDQSNQLNEYNSGSQSNNVVVNAADLSQINTNSQTAANTANQGASVGQYC